MGSYNYSMAGLAKIDGLDAAKAAKNFKSRHAFFNRLTDFIDESHKFIHTYNPVVVVYSEEACADFLSSLKEMKRILKQLETELAESDIKVLEDAALSKNEKTLSSELRKFNTSLSTLCIHIESVRTNTEDNDSVPEMYNFSELVKIKELDAEKALGNFKSRHEYYGKLTSFVENMDKFVGSYNPIVVLFSEEVRREFVAELEQIKLDRGLLCLNFLDVGISSLEDALNSGSEKVLSDGLTNLTAKMKIIIERLEGARSAGATYDIDELNSITELSVPVIKDAKARAKYFNALTEFTGTTHKLLSSYNPIVVMYGDDMRRDFVAGLNEIKRVLKLIEMKKADKETKDIETALNSGDSKMFSDELLKFNARLELLARNIKAACGHDDKAEAAQKDDTHVNSRIKYFGEINKFIESSRKFIKVYNKSHDMYGEDVSSDFKGKLQEMKKITAQLETLFK